MHKEKIQLGCHMKAERAMFTALEAIFENIVPNELVT